jgi:hypothetical protein
VDAPIAVTDGLIGIRSGALPNQATVILGPNKPSGQIAFASERRWPATGDVLVRCDLPNELRSSGNAGRALRLLLHHLATSTGYRAAILEVSPADAGLAAIAAQAGFTARVRRR